MVIGVIEHDAADGDNEAQLAHGLAGANESERLRRQRLIVERSDEAFRLLDSTPQLRHEVVVIGGSGGTGGGQVELTGGDESRDAAWNVCDVPGEHAERGRLRVRAPV